MKIKDVFCNPIINEIERVEIEILLCFVLKKSRAYLIAHPEDELSTSTLDLLHENLQRRKMGEPIAYILGKKEFWSKEFIINSHTLIPRPETELLIESVLDKFSTDEQFQFLELGTGSGVISIILSTLYPKSNVLATDISEEALEIAQKNKNFHEAKGLTILKSDWFSNVSRAQKFDLIISNPPYLSKTDPHLLWGDLRFEPASALIAGQSGLECLEKIIGEARNFLKHGGSLMLEHGYSQAECVEALFKENGYSEVSLKKDLNDLPRVTMGKNLL